MINRLIVTSLGRLLGMAQPAQQLALRQLHHETCSAVSVPDADRDVKLLGDAIHVVEVQVISSSAPGALPPEHFDRPCTSSFAPGGFVVSHLGIICVTTALPAALQPHVACEPARGIEPRPPPYQGGMLAVVTKQA